MSWFAGWNGGGAPTSSALAPVGTMPGSYSGSMPGSGDGPIKVGDMVEYFSSSQNNWILAKVLLVNPSGTYNLDCKPDVPASKVRKPQGGPATGSSATGSSATPTSSGSYAPGEMVEYYSASQGNWIPSKVLTANPRGTYNLDCKPDVTTDKIRKMAPSSRNNLGSSSSMSSMSSMAGSQPGSQQAGLGGMFSSFMSPSTAPKSTGELRPGQQDRPVQLIRVNKTFTGSCTYEVCAEGAAMLERHGSRRIAIASVCGLYRTGKSYLLNLLLERVQKGLPLFTVGNTSRACTEGLWLYGSLDSDDDNRPLLAFIDCEGFGSTDSDKTRDAQLLTLCSLLSSVLLLNTKGVLNESLFNALSLTCKFAEHIEERGNEASRPALLWVLRDFMLELRDAQGRPTSPDEYLEQALSAAPTVGHDADRGQGAREVRQSLLKFFSHRSCVTLVQPAIEERQLQNLSNMPYSSLRSEFRAGVEALRTQIVTTCNSNPKTISGHPLGCFAFVQLLRQLVTSMNEAKAISVKGAWETVQHTACGSLSDELRNSACDTLRTLAKGTPLPGGAQLPLTDEALRMVLRHQRHELKSQWEERAVGDEAVRKEYWQELKESLAREEFVVRQQNVRIADQRLVDALKHWQEWLDSESSSWHDGERAAKEMGQLFEQMPAAPLSRTARAAIEAAGRRVAAARSAVTATTEQSAESQRHAVAFGEKAAQQHGAARTELDAKRKEVAEHQESLRVARSLHATSQSELDRRNAELDDSKRELQKLLDDLEDHRGREHEHKKKHAYNDEKHAAMQADLNKIQQDYAKAQADHLSATRLHGSSQETWDAERRRMEAELQRTQSASEAELRRMEADLNQHRTQVAETHGQVKLASSDRDYQEAENSNLKSLHAEEKTNLKSLHAAEKSRLEAAAAAEKSRLEAELDQLRPQVTEKNRLVGELNAAQLQVSEKRRLEYELEHHKNMAEDKDKRTDAELQTLRSQAGDTSRFQRELADLHSDQKRLQSELEFAKSQAEKYAQQLTEERHGHQSEKERLGTSHSQEQEETRTKLEDERKLHNASLDSEKNRLLDKNRDAAVWEGKVQTLTEENKMLHAKLDELQKQARQAGTHKATADKLSQDLEAQKETHAKSMDEQKADYEKKMAPAPAEGEKKKQAKCGCAVM